MIFGKTGSRQFVCQNSPRDTTVHRKFNLKLRDYPVSLIRCILILRSLQVLHYQTFITNRIRHILATLVALIVSERNHQERAIIRLKTIS